MARTRSRSPPPHETDRPRRNRSTPPRDSNRDRGHRPRRRDDEDRRRPREDRDRRDRGGDGGERERHRDRDRDRARGSREERGSRDKDRGAREEDRGPARSSREKSYNGDKDRPKEDPRAALARRAAGSSAPGPGTGANADTTEGEPVEKEAANFGNTGLLAAATNTINGVVLKYSEPAEARKPPGSQKWRLFVFKDKNIVDNIDLNVNSCWLVGRDRAVADLPVDHPSCSKQHAVIQFRFVTKVGEFGDKESSVKPYLLDLDSANGTFVGKDRIPEKRYFELKEGDLVKFGLSTREYVFMLEKD
ncbi:SMAD/FHA domain-containing protein [Morchella snyderi]|nr:SMAD/FHA domain-containing protein [Morchella snyderi]